jgi:hypothetical protein
VIASPHTPATPEVGASALMEPHDDVNAAFQQQGDLEIRAIIAVGQENIAFVELLVQGTEESGFTCLLARNRSRLFPETGAAAHEGNS